ncbi:MAG: aerobic-type carbon monoxide dehydrogenase, small subunit CoxS/CutS-like protein, partial [Deltaproteobacteria bacterium]|nr:aerobic-type carbon monoxide dehydrogenase, small subunit CoxS/CutS-like protein [Deltaproteobacteria bacterium]
MRYPLKLTVNGELHELEIPAQRTLLDVIREDLGFTGTKQGCGNGECGACTVLLEGEPVNACLVLALQADGKSITTIEGVSRAGALDPIQEAFIAKGAIQCGFCTPGMVLSVKALLDRNPRPDEMEIREALTGNFCRCTGYQKIVEAVHSLTH